MYKKKNKFFKELKEFLSYDNEVDSLPNYIIRIVAIISITIFFIIISSILYYILTRGVQFG